MELPKIYEPIETFKALEDRRGKKLPIKLVKICKTFAYAG